MKWKFVIVSILAVVAALIIGNFYLGKQQANVLDRQLQDLKITTELPYIFRYDQITVNPVCSKVNFRNLSIQNITTQEIYTAELVMLKIPFQELTRMVETRQINQLKSLRIFQKSVLFCDSDKAQVYFAQIRVIFKGNLNLSSYHKGSTLLPTEPQSITIDFLNAQINFQKIKKLSIEKNTDLSNFSLKKGNVGIFYYPEKQSFQIDDLSIKTKDGQFNFSSLIHFTGVDFTSFKISDNQISGHFNFHPVGEVWGSKTDYGEYRIDQFLLDFSSFSERDSLRNQQQLRESTADLLLLNFAVAFHPPRLQQLTVNVLTNYDGLQVDTLKVSYIYRNNQLTIRDFLMRTSLFDADLNAIVLVKPADLMNSEIDSARFVLSHLDKRLQFEILKLELALGQSLPRKDQDIVLEISGNLHQPRIKGLKL